MAQHPYNHARVVYVRQPRRQQLSSSSDAQRSSSSVVDVRRQVTHHQKLAWVVSSSSSGKSPREVLLGFVLTELQAHRELKKIDACVHGRVSTEATIWCSLPIRETRLSIASGISSDAYFDFRGPTGAIPTTVNICRQFQFGVKRTD